MRRNFLFISLFIFMLFITLNCRRAHTADKDNSSFSMKHNGIERTYCLYVPSSYDKSRETPLVIALHGGSGTGEGFNKMTGGNFQKLAEKERFILVCPDGIEKHWNDGRKIQKYRTQKENVDDVGFISALIDHIAEKLNIDKNSIYVTGISNGGLMSYRLACELSDKIAAFAPVCANMTEDLLSVAKPPKPVSIMIINGTDDPLMPYKGGEINFLGLANLGKVIPTSDTVKFWVKNNHCKDTPDVKYLEDKDPKDGTKVKCEIYTGGDKGTEVILYTVEGGGHTWPGGVQYLPEKMIGKTCRDINCCEVIWEFFKKHKLVIGDR